MNVYGGSKVLHPDFPTVEGTTKITQDWSLTLDQTHSRRVEDGALVFWHPGFTIWINVWSNDNNESISKRVEWIDSGTNPDSFDVESYLKGNVHFYLYRLNEETEGKVTHTYNGFIFSGDSHVQITAYFDRPADFNIAGNILKSIRFTNP